MSQEYDIAGAFEAIEDELIGSMMRNFSRHRAEETAEGYNWEMWQAKQLESLELYRKQNKKRFRKQFRSINSKISEMLKAVRENGNAAQEAEILQRISDGFKAPRKPSGAPSGEFFRVNDRKLDALIKATQSDLQRAEHAILRMSNDRYRSAIFNAQVYANTGAGTYEKAVDMACRDYLRAGLNCIEYKNGSRHTLEEYSRMAIRTANKRAYLMGEGEKRAEWGISTVVVNSRMGGCPLCAPYIGKVFIDDVYSGGSSRYGKYPLLSTAIAGGLFHPNCKDGTSTYYEGVTTLRPVTKAERAAMQKQDALEQRKKYHDLNAKKCARIAEYSLDPDNRRAYAARAAVHEEKASEIAEKLPKTVDIYDESGIIKIQSLSRYVNSSDELFEYAQKVRPIDGYEDVFIHGDKKGFTIKDKDGKERDYYSPREFAEILRSDPNYHGGKVRLFSCEAGAEGATAAQALANQLGIDVMAPSDLIWLDFEGNIFIGPVRGDNEGRWIVFKPQ